jgi:hypothetical protein
MRELAAPYHVTPRSHAHCKVAPPSVSGRCAMQVSYFKDILVARIAGTPIEGVIAGTRSSA